MSAREGEFGLTVTIPTWPSLLIETTVRSASSLLKRSTWPQVVKEARTWILAQMGGGGTRGTTQGDIPAGRELSQGNRASPGPLSTLRFLALPDDKKSRFSQLNREQSAGAQLPGSTRNFHAGEHPPQHPPRVKSTGKPKTVLPQPIPCVALNMKNLKMNGDKRDSQNHRGQSPRKPADADRTIIQNPETTNAAAVLRLDVLFMPMSGFVLEAMGK